MPSKYLEDIDLPGHRGRPAMSVGDRVWLVALRNRPAVLRLWHCLEATSKTLIGSYGFLTTDALDDAGVRESLIAHWRSIDYADNGERIETIPGSMIAGDLFRLGLGLADIEQGTVVAPQRRPAACERRQGIQPVTQAKRRHEGHKAAQAASTHEPVLVRRRGQGVARGE